MEELRNIPQVSQLKCDTCARAKSHTRNITNHTSKRFSHVGYKFHTEMSGRINSPSMQGTHYFMVLVDDTSGYKFVHLIKNKDEFL